MKESDLYIPVRDWLQARGWEIHVELFDADIIALKDGILRAVELKTCLSQDLMRQLHDRVAWADEVVAVIPTEPKRVKGLQFYGFGLLQVRNGKVHQRLKPKPQPWSWHKKRKYRMKKLTGLDPAQPFELAGLTSIELAKQKRGKRG